ncbi:NB-ARC domain-containing protein [Actinomadura madurae]|uniref:NB-ARC domain-containing protein n=1 Tax=Actinomadura madurae TaxID=1993 RepID=UPI002026D3AB|nr:NB-ARC domain-containing protein [Actinomadura madurae]URN09654.1 NB-ARC domain-containing protein [Actinomadura madurae]
MALAGAGGAAVVQMMVSDGWESAKGRLARLLGRGTPAEVTAMEDRLESARTQLASLPEHELEQAMRVQAAVWQERLVDLLEAAPEVEEELRGLVGRVDARQGTTGVRQQAVLLSGIQINRFSAPPSLDEAIGTIAVPAGRRYEDAPLRGRDELIAELVEALSRPGSAERVHLLHGLGGAGKSSVALEVACRVQEKGAGVWWIPASDAGRVTMGMLNLARRLRLSDAEIAHRDVADLIWERLADRDTPWLLVFDNADDPAVLTIDDAPLPDGTGWLRPVATAAGMAIVTSRHGRVPDWGGWCRAHDVGMLTPAEGAQVLLDGTGSKAGSRADAESLSRRLGGLPLALRLAGSYLAQSQQMPRIFADPERARTFAEYRSALDVDPPEAGFPPSRCRCPIVRPARCSGVPGSCRSNCWSAAGPGRCEPCSTCFRVSRTRRFRTRCFSCRGCSPNPRSFRHRRPVARSGSPWSPSRTPDSWIWIRPAMRRTFLYCACIRSSGT